MNGMTQNSHTVYQSTWWQNALLGTEIGTGLLTALFAILGILSVVKKTKVTSK